MINLIKNQLNNFTTSIGTSLGSINYFKNTLWVIFEKLFRLVIGITTSMLITRYLGPTQFGQLSYVQSYVGLFAAIAPLGLDSIIVKEIINNKDKIEKILSTAFILKLIGALIVILIISLVMLFSSIDKFTNLLIFIIALSTFFNSFNVIDFYFQSTVESRYTVYSNIIALFLTGILKILCVIFHTPLIVFAWLILLESIIQAVGLYFFFKKKYNPTGKLNFIKITLNYQTALLLLKFSWSLILSDALVTIYMRMDQIMIHKILDFKSVGIFAASARLTEIWYFVPVVISNSLFPAIINSKNQNPELFNYRLQSLYKLVIWIAILIAIFVSIFSNWIILFLYGENYIESRNILIFHIWSGVFVFFGTVRGKWLIVEDLQKYGFYYLLCGTVLNFILNFVLIKNYGVVGASLATLITLISIALIFPLLNKKTRPSVVMFFNSLNIIKILYDIKNIKKNK